MTTALYRSPAPVTGEELMAELTRRDLIKTAGATAAATGAAALPGPVSGLLSGSARAADAARPWNHDPASPIGPLHWNTIDPICGLGKAQSPVDIRTDRLAMYHGSPLLLMYERSEARVGNTGHYLWVPTPEGTDGSLRIGDDVYPLVQYHFHVPAEHTVDGRLADLEAHFVHTNSRGVSAAVGIFFFAGCDPNPLLDSILLAAPETAGEEASIGSRSPAELFRNLSGVATTPSGALQVESFYSYDGSLTTPGCGEGILWSVLTGGGQVSDAALARFHHLIARFPYYNGYPNNNRPLQPLNGRIIRVRHGRGFD
jgi:carbonic anhydrase